MKVLKFYAEWCGPCKMLSKVIEGIEDLNTEIVEIDIDKDPDTAVQYKVRGVPTCVLVDGDGNEVKRKVGAMSAPEFKAFVS